MRGLSVSKGIPMGTDSTEGTRAPLTRQDREAARQQRLKERRVAKFRHTEKQAKLRLELWKIDPRCTNCRKLLQVREREIATTYANVCCGKLCCHECVLTVHRLHLESEVQA